MHDSPHRGHARRDLVKDVVVSSIYTGVIVALVRLKVLQPLENYFPEK